MFRWCFAAVIASAVFLAACTADAQSPTPTVASPPTRGLSASSQNVTPQPTATPALEQSAYPNAKLEFNSYRGPVGTKLTITGSGFPASQEVALSWQTFDGRWAFELENLIFVGPRFDESAVEITKLTSDASGALRASFTVPEDFGGWHNIVARIGGKLAARNAFFITATFTVSTTTGPVGTPLLLTATGLGWRLQESLYLVTWDNAFTGYMMGVTRKGSATAALRIAGGPGPHVLKIWRNFRGIPFLIPHQGPFGALPDSLFTINVTSGVYQAAAVWADPSPETVLRAAPAPKSQGGARLTTAVNKGIVGAKVALQGEGFQAGQPVKVTWTSRTGRKITDTGLMEGYEEAITELASVNAGADGRFQAQIEVPNDHGGPHRITATSGDRSAEAYFYVYPAVTEFTERVKIGGDIVVRLRGQDWTVQGKTYAVVYDNKFVGYVCGYSSGGYVDLHLPAAGPPGPHTIDFYPSMYEGKDPTPNIYSMPDLTYRDNTSWNAVAPTFRMTVTITE